MKRLLPFLGLALLFVSFGAHAQLSNDGLLTDIATRYQSAASAWATYIMGRATWLYWTLVTISLVWTGGMMLLRGAGLQEFFSEFVRFIMTTGFFWWLLMMAPTFVPGIYQSMSMIGASASGLGSDLRPSGIVDIGFAVLNATLDNSSFMEPIDSLIGFLMAMVILIVLALIAVNMVVLLISGWVVGYAGIIYLGFGGSRWTSEMAISFYKTVLAIGIQLMAMILLVGIGKTFMDDYYARMAAGSVELKEMAVLMVASLVLLVLVNKVPQLISSIASSNVGMSGLGSYGSGTALAAAGVAGAAVGVGASMIAAGAANIAGGASAIKAAFSQGGSNVASGTDVMAKMAGGAGGGAAGGGSDAGGGGGGGGAGTASSTPFAQAAGLDSQGGGASVSSIAGRSSSGGDSGGGSGSGGEAAAAGEAASPAAGGAAGGNEGAAGGGGGGSPSSSGPSEGEGGQAMAGASTAAPAASDGPMAAAGGGGSDGGAGAAPSMASRAGAAVAKAGRISADAGANLAMGAFDVGKQAVASRMEKFGERVSQTMGGKMADAINQRQESGREAASPTFTGDGITGAGVSMASAGAAAAAAAGEGEAKTAAPLDPEVAKFMQRDGSAG